MPRKPGYDLASEETSSTGRNHAPREDPCQKEALPVTIVWILIVIILVLLAIALVRRVL